MELLEELDRRPLCGDAAMGTALLAAGAPADSCLEELCLSRPELVLDLHRQHLQAGAQIIRTNTFGANIPRLARHGLKGHLNEINRQAVQLARQAARETDARVAGTVGPLDLPAASPAEREELFRAQIGVLLDAGATLIAFETFQDIEELLSALHAKQALHHCPAICSLVPDEHGLLPDDTSLEEAFARLAAADAEIAGLNCVNGPLAALAALESLPAPPPIPLAVFPNAGPHHEIPPAEFANAAPFLISRGVRLLGGCCGTTAAHVAALATALHPK